MRLALGAALGEDRLELEAHAGQERLLPDDVVPVFGALRELEIARAHLVSKARDAAQRPQDERREDETARHGDAPVAGASIATL